MKTANSIRANVNFQMAFLIIILVVVNLGVLSYIPDYILVSLIVSGIIYASNNFTAQLLKGMADIVDNTYYTYREMEKIEKKIQPDIQKEQTSQTPFPPSYTKAQVVDESEKICFCPDCGSKISDDRTCPKCGKHFI